MTNNDQYFIHLTMGKIVSMLN